MLLSDKYWYYCSARADIDYIDFTLYKNYKVGGRGQTLVADKIKELYE